MAQDSPQISQPSQAPDSQPGQHQDQGPPAQSGPSPQQDPDGALDDSLEGTLRAIEAERANEERKRPAPAREDPDSPDADKRPPVPKASVIASIHRREQQLATKAQDLSQREAELKQREAVLAKGKYTPFEALKLLGYDDPKKFMEQIVETGGEWTPEAQKIYELEQWKSQQEAREKEREQQLTEEKQAQEYRAIVDSWHKSIAQYTLQSPKWQASLLAIPGTESTVFDVIQDHYRETGERMEFDDALEVVNQNMEGTFTGALQQIASNPRGRAILEEFAAKLAPEAKRGKSATAQRGLSTAVRNQSRPVSTPAEDMDLDSAVAANARWLSEVTRR